MAGQIMNKVDENKPKVDEVANQWDSGINPGMSKNELLKFLRLDAYEALLKANPSVSRQVLRENSRILAKDWYRKIQTGEIQFGVRIENGRNGEQEGSEHDKLPGSGDLIRKQRWQRGRKGFRQRPRQ